jgi:crossover junction endodeoxyribonuclease RusA
MTLFQPEPELLLQATVPWTPKAKARPRVTKTGHAYTEPATVKAERQFVEEFKAIVGDHTPFDFPIEMRSEFANDFVLVEFYRAEDYTHRKLRGDVDNYIKLVSDALNEVAYVDDRLIVTLSGKKL